MKWCPWAGLLDQVEDEGCWGRVKLVINPSFVLLVVRV